MIPRSSGSPGTTFSELAGIMKSEVTIRLRSGRAEMPCGLKSCTGGFVGHSPTSRRFRSNSATRPGVPPVCEPICVTRNPPSFSGRKSSVMFESVPLVENRNLGWRAFDTSKKKMLF